MYQRHESMLTLITPKTWHPVVQLMQRMGRLSSAMDGLVEENSEARKVPISWGCKADQSSTSTLHEASHVAI